MAISQALQPPTFRRPGEANKRGGLSPSWTLPSRTIQHGDRMEQRDQVMKSTALVLCEGNKESAGRHAPPPGLSQKACLSRHSETAFCLPATQRCLGMFLNTTTGQRSSLRDSIAAMTLQPHDGSKYKRRTFSLQVRSLGASCVLTGMEGHPTSPEATLTVSPACTHWAWCLPGASKHQKSWLPEALHLPSHPRTHLCSPPFLWPWRRAALWNL